MEDFQPAPPPYDRALALACRLGTFRDLWLCCVCPQHTRMLPINLMCRTKSLAQSSLADVLVRLRCEECHQRPQSIALQKMAIFGHSNHYPDAWVLPLRDAPTQKSGPEATPEAAVS
jgi:hypothetical protein